MYRSIPQERAVDLIIRHFLTFRINLQEEIQSGAEQHGWPSLFKHAAAEEKMWSLHGHHAADADGWIAKLIDFPFICNRI